jgi:HEAT repeat protein
MNVNANRIFFAFAIVYLFVSFNVNAQAQAASDEKLEKAIAALRNINQSKLSEEEQGKKGKEIDDAWSYIRSIGPAGVTRLKQEVQKVEQNKEKDDYFKLNASALLWIIGKLDEAQAIAAIWNTTPLEAQSNYVFYTAFEAAKTQDPKALPILEATLRNQDFRIYVAQHSMEVRWPRTIEFIWGAYGSKGIPELERILNTSQDSVTLQSAIRLLTIAYDYKVLPKIREIAAKSKGDERFTAAQALGFFGHPQDYEFLISNLKPDDVETTYWNVYALYEYEDLRAVTRLVPLLKIENEFFQQEVAAALFHLAVPESIDAFNTFCNDKKNQKLCSGPIDSHLSEMKLTWEAYKKMSPAQKEKFLADYRNSEEEKYKLNKNDMTLTRQQLVAAINNWKENGRAFEKGTFSKPPNSKPNEFVFTSPAFGWVEERHILSVATPDDVSALLDARASIYRRLSDECLHEVRRINEILKRIVRKQYRKEVGLSGKVI